MNYKLHYDNLILKARNRSILKWEYKETHHIIPKCLGGDNSKGNLVELFPEEHLLSHLLLAKIYPDKALIYAAFRMTNYKKLTNKSYAWVRKKYSKLMSERIVSDETRRKNSEWQKGKTYEEKFGVEKAKERKNQLSIENTGKNNNMFGKTHTDDVKQILREKNLEQFANYSDEQKKDIFGKISKANSKLWIVVTPEGKKIEILNLKEFCKNNGLLYEAMLAVKNGKQKTHKGGWKCFYK